MANEIQFRGPRTGDTLYAVIRRQSDAKMWNGSAFETLVVANWATYDIALTETPASSYLYLADWPAGISAAAAYQITIFNQAGVTPATTDDPQLTYACGVNALPLGAAWSGTTALYTPASLYAELQIIFGADAAGTTNRKALILSAMKGAAVYLWKYARWDFRHRVQSLTTTDGESYTVLPTDYERDPQAGDWLNEATDTEYRPRFVEPANWNVDRIRVLVEFSADSGTPQIWTVGMQSIAGSYYPVVRWSPIPDAEYIFEGFQYYAGVPTIDETSTDALFPDAEFDLAWFNLSVAFCRNKGLVAVEQDPDKTAFPTWAQVRSHLVELVSKHATQPIPVEPRDVYRMSEDLTVYPDEISTWG